MSNEWILGDSFEILPTLADQSVNMVLTDPPYNTSIHNMVVLHNQFLRICKGAIIVFMPPENQWILPAHQYLFWIKPISTKNTSKSYSRFVEMMFVYYNTDAPTWNSDRHWSQYTNVFTDLVDDSSLHPYRKPPSLIERLILNHTNEGDTVLDPFCGSGVVGDVCERLKRNFICIDIMDGY
jgi:DNA modification methylase